MEGRSASALKGIGLSLAETARESEGRVSFVGERGEVALAVPWRHLFDRAERAACGLRALTGPYRRPVAVVGSLSPETIVAIFAVLFTGRPVAVVPPAHHRRRKGPVPANEHLLSRAGLVIMAEPSAEPFGRASGIRTTTVAALENAASGVRTVEPAAASEIAVLQLSSGTTGGQKVLGLGSGGIEANLRAISTRIGAHRHDRFVSWLPLYHDMGLFGMLLLPALLGADAVYVPTEVYASRPHLWMAAAGRYGGTLLCAPNAAYRAAARCLSRDDGIDLGSVRAAFCGAELVRAGDLTSFTAAAAPLGLDPDVVSGCYGLAEATLAVTMCRPGSGLAAVRRTGERLDVSCGPPLDGVDVRVGKPDRPSAGPGDGIGEVYVKSPSLFREAYGAETMKAEEFLDSGWLATGDIGYLHNGELYLRGRSKDMLNVAGRNIPPEDVEDVVANVAGVRRGRVVAFRVDDAGGRERVVVMAEPAGAAGDHADAVPGLERAIRDAVAESCRIGLRDVRIVPRGSIEKTTSGKLRRRVMRDSYLTYMGVA
ncbi:AMP-binding protein [Actinomadura fulvescens]|uniref:Long-chain-fatty acid--ACP ligase MbtM n=1 Tax=Actinomadura fulvescens TaxID=46160 RepID=A0ABN3PHT9_9ACTN